MDLEDVKPERFICGCGGVGHFFIRLRKALAKPRRGRVQVFTDIRFYCADCVGVVPAAMRPRVLPVNETEA